MTQITHGIRSILSHPTIYSTFQQVMGIAKVRSFFTEKYIKPFQGMRILDIGCGPADILSHLRGVEYFGFDLSAIYIKNAQAKFKEKGTFYCKELHNIDIDKMPPFDVVLSMGLLHHLDDTTAINTLQLAARALKQGGRFLTMDPCFVNKQNSFAKFLIKNDRGQHVRTEDGYSKLADKVFKSFEMEIRHKKWIPYTHCFMECTKE